jgi:hypothetical protein
MHLYKYTKGEGWEREVIYIHHISWWMVQGMDCGSSSRALIVERWGVMGPKIEFGV